MSLAVLAVRIIDAAAFILYLLIIARIVVSWLPVSPWNPFVRILRSIVDPVLRPFRRLLPSLGGIDLSPLVAILLIFFVSRLADQVLLSFAIGGQVNVAADIVLLIAQLLENILLILGLLVLIRLLVALFSADPWHPLVMGIRSLTNPLVRPFAHFGSSGLRGGLDTPALLTLVAYVIVYVAITVLVNQLLLRVL
jgi:YggT family protein